MRPIAVLPCDCPQRVLLMAGRAFAEIISRSRAPCRPTNGEADCMTVSPSLDAFGIGSDGALSVPGMLVGPQGPVMIPPGAPPVTLRPAWTDLAGQVQLPGWQFCQPLPYGAILRDAGVQFAVFSRAATALRVLLYNGVND